MEAIEQLAPHVRLDGRPDQREVQAFARLVRLGQVPTAAAVSGEMAAMQEHEARRDRLARLLDDASRVGREVAAYVHQHQQSHGDSPAWQQVAHHMGWPQGAADQIMPKLRQAGWITYDRQPRSLRLGPAHLDEGTTATEAPRSPDDLQPH